MTTEALHSLCGAFEFTGRVVTAMVSNLVRPRSFKLPDFGAIVLRAGADAVPVKLLVGFLLANLIGLAHIRFFTESPDGTVKVLDATPAIPIPTENDARPTAADAVFAISKALTSIEL